MAEDSKPPKSGTSAEDDRKPPVRHERRKTRPVKNPKPVRITDFASI